MESRKWTLASVFGALVALGLVVDSTILSSEAEAFCLGKKCRERKARKLSGKALAACEQDPNSKSCARQTNRLDRVLGRRNMKGYVKDQKLDRSQVSLAQQLVRKRWCEMKGLTQPDACLAAYNARNAPGGYQPVGSGLGGGGGTVPNLTSNTEGATKFSGPK